MSWNTKLFKKFKIGEYGSINRNQLLRLHDSNELIILLNVSYVKRNDSNKLWLKTKDIAINLLKEIHINKYDQYYHRLIRILRNLVFKKCIRHNKIKRSYNKKLRLDFKKGSNNIIVCFAENINLAEGCSVPKGQEDLPRKIMNRNFKKIKEVFGQ